jgi:hypothetical protein
MLSCFLIERELARAGAQLGVELPGAARDEHPTDLPTLSAEAAREAAERLDRAKELLVDPPGSVFRIAGARVKESVYLAHQARLEAERAEAVRAAEAKEEAREEHERTRPRRWSPLDEQLMLHTPAGRARLAENNRRAHQESPSEDLLQASRSDGRRLATMDEIRNEFRNAGPAPELPAEPTPDNE